MPDHLQSNETSPLPSEGVAIDHVIDQSSQGTRAKARLPVRPSIRIGGGWHLFAILPHALRELRRRPKMGAVAHVMAIRVLALVGNVCSGLLTAKFLGPDGRGELAALLIAPTVLAPFCTLGLHASLIFNVRLDPEDSPRYFGGALILTFFAGLAAMALGFLLIPTWLSHYTGDTIALARMLLVVVPFGVMSVVFMAILEADGKFAKANSVLYLQSLITLAILGGLVTFSHLTPRNAAEAYTFLAFPTFIYLAVQACRVVRPRLTFTAPYPQRLLRYGLRFYGVDILGAVSGYLDQVIIVFLLQPEAVGAYAVALSLSRVLTIAQGAVSTVLFPSVAARDVVSVVETVARAMRVMTVVNSVAAAAMATAGPFLLLLLYGARFSAAVAPFLILLLEAVVTSAARTLGQAFSGSGRPDAVTALELAGVATIATSMLVLVPFFGIVGASCAALLGGCVRMAYVLASFRAVLGVNLPRLSINWRDVAWVLGR